MALASRAAGAEAGDEALERRVGATHRVAGLRGEGKIHRVDPDFGSTLTASNRDYQSNCWVNWKIMGQPCEFQVAVGAFGTALQEKLGLVSKPVRALSKDGAKNSKRVVARQLCHRVGPEYGPASGREAGIPRQTPGQLINVAAAV
jgi:hypothetical protein